MTSIRYFETKICPTYRKKLCKTTGINMKNAKSNKKKASKLIIIFYEYK